MQPLCSLLTYLAVITAPAFPPPPSAAAFMPPATTAPATTAPADATTPDPADDLLTRLEASAATLRGFTAKIDYRTEDMLLGRREIRRGELVYDADPATGAKRFALLFDEIIRGQRRETRLRHYVFDGQWLAEIDHEAKQFVKTQIVPPGRTLDPLKLGEGPFPLPVGQPVAEVKARFGVAPLAPPSEGPLASLTESYELEGLRLVPREGTDEAEEIARVDLFYDSATLLPVGIELREHNGDVKIVRLTEVARDPELTDEQKSMLRIAEPDPREWAVTVQPWRGG